MRSFFIILRNNYFLFLVRTIAPPARARPIRAKPVSAPVLVFVEVLAVVSAPPPTAAAVVACV